jgi:hypothetical protein
VADDVEAQLERDYEALMADTEAERRAGVLKQLAGLAILLALVGINALWFDAAGRSYFTWYLDNGALIALVFGVVSVAVELDGHPELIAAGPIRFVLGIVAVFLELTTSFWAMFGRAHGDRAFDTVLAAVFAVVFALAMLAWALVVAPLQFFLNLVAGAPARTALASSSTVWRVQTDATHTEYVYGPKDLSEVTDRDEAQRLADGLAAGTVTQTTFAAKPVALTNAIAAALLFGASQLV